MRGERSYLLRYRRGGVGIGQINRNIKVIWQNCGGTVCLLSRKIKFVYSLRSKKCVLYEIESIMNSNLDLNPLQKKNNCTRNNFQHSYCSVYEVISQRKWLSSYKPSPKNICHFNVRTFYLVYYNDKLSIHYKLFQFSYRH